jgi:hypothetical protein
METYDSAWVDAQVAKTAEVWHSSCEGGVSRNARQFSARDQQEREAAYDEALQTVEKDLERAERAGMQERIVASFARFSAKALDLDSGAIDLLTHDFLPAGTQLARWARRFDASLGMSEIIQAARNAWTACGLQPLLGAQVDLTPSILGYSLLYPYSDNYLDDEGVRAETKLQFSRRFRRRLLGEKPPAADNRERAMWTLIGLIETQYPRACFPQVFGCLLAIHQAQEQSVVQLHNGTAANDAEYLRLSCAKGGTSVLADACLANGSLNKEESRFAFEWGVLLQLGDDLQDVRDDMRRGSTTLFSRAAARGRPLDALTCQLLSFSEKVGKHMQELPHGSPTLKKLLEMSWRSLIVRAVADSHEFFSPGFLHEAERSSPFRFEFLRRRSERLAGRAGLYASLFDALLESHRDSGGGLSAREVSYHPPREEFT